MSGVFAKQLTNDNPLTFSRDSTTDEIVRMMLIRIDVLKFLLKRDVSFEEATHALNWVNNNYIKGVNPYGSSQS
jgi:hypothetical protein